MLTAEKENSPSFIIISWVLSLNEIVKCKWVASTFIIGSGFFFFFCLTKPNTAQKQQNGHNPNKTRKSQGKDCREGKQKSKVNTTMLSSYNYLVRGHPRGVSSLFFAHLHYSLFVVGTYCADHSKFIFIKI